MVSKGQNEAAKMVTKGQNIVISTNKGEPTVTDDNSFSGQAYRNITKRILGEDIPLMELEVKKGFLESIKKMFRAGN